jgi:hypothetical protein
MRDISAFALLVWWYVCVREREIRRGLREAWPKKKNARKLKLNHERIEVRV